MFTNFIILMVAAFAAFAAALPTNLAHSSSASNIERQDSCGANSTAHCCNDETTEALTHHDSFTDLLELKNLLGQCSDITVAVIGGAVPIKNMCKQTAVCCGDMEQAGVVNVGCTPLNVN
ncbi:hypothetical protein ACET3X_009459 [Alternaria dauci]|uniref:Hydrophobin n=1 Tax=Alternaria dauci TaxID=48095 RepID=A0ABR3U8U7_9PLEO